MKRTEMSPAQLKDYIEKWNKRLQSYVPGSKNWRKTYERIKIARQLQK